METVITSGPSSLPRKRKNQNESTPCRVENECVPTTQCYCTDMVTLGHLKLYYIVKIPLLALGLGRTFVDCCLFVNFLTSARLALEVAAAAAAAALAAASQA